ncbi:MAG: exopolysaccharide biosynthesis polyprenyl glycosylphosphotransferase [Arenicella sp.]|nr:exopolysaccharide biosynthesis polyprenyl glycosylphosphotransferase [Arenicella sp.]
MAFNAFRRTRSVLILGADFFSIVGIFSMLYFIRLEKLPDYLEPELWLIVATFLATLFISGTYFKGQNTILPRLPVRTFFICLSAGVICIFWVYLLGPSQFNNYFGRGVLPVGTVLIGIAATLFRLFINRRYFHHEEGLELLYLGFSDSAKAFLQESENHAEIRSISIMTDEPVDAATGNFRLLSPGDTKSILQQSWNGIILDPNHQSDQDEASRLVSLRLQGTPVLSLSDYYERNWYMVPVNHIGDEWFLQSHGFMMLGSPITLRVKRLVDVILSIVLGAIAAPIILLCALLIKLTSAGPVLFRQTRIGLQGRPFTIYKLRTMIKDAEAEGAQWAEDDDPRITAVGNFLRKSRLDELPQVWNVLRGEMSFIGPRPERPEFTHELAEQIPYYDLRHMVKPGISGWAQVIFPYGASTEDSLKKLQYELYYIKNQSLLLDLNIMLRTLATVFQRAGR